MKPPMYVARYSGESAMERTRMPPVPLRSRRSRMTRKLRWSVALIGAALLSVGCGVSGGVSRAEQSAPPQPPVQRDDPATSGAGPTSGAPGQLDYNPPKGSPPATTDSRGVTTRHPNSDGAKTDGVKPDGEK